MISLRDSFKNINYINEYYNEVYNIIQDKIKKYVNKIEWGEMKKILNDAKLLKRLLVSKIFDDGTNKEYYEVLELYKTLCNLFVEYAELKKEDSSNTTTQKNKKVKKVELKTDIDLDKCVITLGKIPKVEQIFHLTTPAALLDETSTDHLQVIHEFFKKIYDLNKALSKIFSYDTYFYDCNSGADRRHKIQQEINIEVCPYCNISYINSYEYIENGTNEEKRKNLFQLDHFYPQSIYPLFALSLYNLIPTCPSCNMIKHDELIDVLYPYDEGFDDGAYFTYDSSKNIIIKISKDISPEKKRRIENSISLLHLEENYSCHKLYLEHLLNKKVLYANGLLKKLNKFMKNNHIKGNAEVFAFGMKLSESEDKFISMSKFTRDIIKR